MSGLRGLHIAAACLLLALLALPAQAAEQPREVPTELRNGQSTDFGTITMEPYVPSGKGAVPIEAHVTLRDLGALTRAEEVMLALNLHSREASLAVDGVRADGDGQPIAPLRTGASDDGLQAQLFVSAHDVLSHAAGGSVSLTFRGHATPRSNGQIHVGTLVVAYASGWATVRSDDGPAQLYAYSLVQSKGAGGWPMPFHGEGNTFLVVPFVVVSVLALTAGGMAVQVLRAGVAVSAAAPIQPGRVRPAVAPTPVPAPPPPNRRVVLGRTEIELSSARPAPPAAPAPASVPVFGAAAPIPVFGSPVSPVLARPATRAPAFRVSSGPKQGPPLPPGWKAPSASSEPAKPPNVPAAAAKPAPARPPRPPAAPAKPPPKRTLTAVRRPKRPAARARQRAPARKAAQPSR